MGAEDEGAVGTGRRAIGVRGRVQGGTEAIGQVLAMWESSQLGGRMQRGQVRPEVSLSVCITVPWLP